MFNWSIRSCLSFHPSKVSTCHSIRNFLYLTQSMQAYKTLDLIRRTFSNSVSSSVKNKLYISLIRSQLMYYSPVWCSHLMKDIIKLEQLQHRATKYILQDFSSDYKSHLTNLNLLPLMYVFEVSDIMFFINNIKNPTSSFNISSYMYHFHTVELDLLT